MLKQKREGLHALNAYDLLDGRFKTYENTQGESLNKSEEERIKQGAIFFFDPSIEFNLFHTIVTRASQDNQFLFVGFNESVFLSLRLKNVLVERKSFLKKNFICL